MTYQNQADLGKDPQFRDRLTAALANEAALKVNDSLADAILKSPSVGAEMFMPLVASAPGFGDQFGSGGQESIDDGELLSAVQASWNKVAELYDSTLNPV